MKSKLVYGLIFTLMESICPVGNDVLAQADQNYPSKEEMQLSRMFIDAERERILGNYQNALDLFARCLEIDPDNDAVHFGIGKAFLEQEMFAEASMAFDRAASLDPKNKWYWLSYGQTLIAQMKYKEAAKVYERVSKMLPSDVELKLDYANTLLYAGKEKKAFKVFDEVEQITGPSHDIARRKYEYLIGEHKYDQAAVELEKLLDIYPGDPQLYSMLAEIYKARGKIDEAIVVYRKALRADPTNPVYQLALAEFFDRNGMRDSSFVYLKQAYSNPNMEIDRKVGVLLRMYEDAEVNEKIRLQVLELCESIVQTHPDDAKSYSLYGDYLLLNGQNREARDAFRSAVEIDPSRFAIWNQMMLLDAQLDDAEGLLKDSRTAMELFPAQPTVFYFNGVANIRLKQFEQAAQSLRMGAKMVIGNNLLSAQILANLGDVYHELGNEEGSDSAYAAALSYEPHNAYVLNNYSYFLSLRGEQLELAREMSAKSLEIDPDNTSYLDTYAWILYGLGEYKEAENYLKRALEHGGESSAEVLEHYGDVQLKLGKPDLAIDHWQKAVDAGGDRERLESKMKSASAEHE